MASGAFDFGALLFGLMRSLGFAVQAANQPIQDWLAHQSGFVKALAAFMTNAGAQCLAVCRDGDRAVLDFA